MSGNPDKRQRKIDSRGGCLILIASWIGSAVLLFLGVRQAVPSLSPFQSEDWSMFWFWGVPSIALFITGIIFLAIGFRNAYIGE